HQILVRGDAEHFREQPQEVERADRGFRSGLFQSARGGGGGGGPQGGRPRRRGLPATTSTKRLASPWPISSSPMSLLPSAADCASSPSTTSSGSGGPGPTRQGGWALAAASAGWGAREEGG